MIVRSKMRSSFSRSSASFAAVMSRVSPKVPMIRPAASRQGIFVLEAQPCVPSRRVRRSTFAITGRPVRMISCSSAKARSACSLAK